jgi:hypothetical protein
MQQEIPEFLRILGVATYAGFTFLAIIWSGIGLDRARRLSRKYYALTAAALCGALFAANLTIIATDPIWISRLALTVINRTAGAAGVIALAVFTVAVFRDEYRHDKIARQHESAPSEPSHSNTLTEF